MRTTELNKNNLIERVKKILKKYGIKKAGIFGSFARGEFRKESDIDIVIEPPEGFSLLDLSRMGNEIEDEIGVRVDILTYRSIHPLLRDKILSEEVRILEE